MEKKITFDTKFRIMNSFFTFIFCFCFFLINAQVLNQVGSSIKNSTTTKAADFNRTRSNKEKNDLDQNATKKTSDEGAGNPEESPEVNAENQNRGKINADYSFHYQLTYEMVNYVDQQVNDSKNMVYYFGDSVTLFFADNAYLLNDLRGKITLMLDENSKTGSSSDLLDQSTGDPDAAGQIDMFRKSGNTRDILGYSCEEYAFVHEGIKLFSLWVAKESLLKKGNIDPSFLTNQVIMGINALSPDPEGFVMEYNQFDGNGQVESAIRVTGFEPAEKLIQLGEYEITTY